MSYIDLNMVRAAAVEDPLEWQWSGYREIQKPPQRYRRVDSARTAELLGLSGPEALRTWQKDAAREMSPARGERDQKWTESIAVGSEAFVREVQGRLAIVGKSREVKAEGDSFVLRERAAGYESGTEGSRRQRADQPPANTIEWHCL
jgi:putative transposase